MIRYLTAGESHGRGLTAVVEGLPANLSIEASSINVQLARRQKGYGRGGRMKIESDRVEILSGVRKGLTLGSPVALFIENRDWKNWTDIMAVESDSTEVKSETAKGRPVTKPRPGHADLTGAIKYRQRDIRNILERSSARETAARVAVGAAAKRFLEEFQIKVYSWVAEIGGVGCGFEEGVGGSVYYSEFTARHESLDEIYRLAEASEVSCPATDVSDAMMRAIDMAKESGDSLGGVFEVVVSGLPVGLGSHVQHDRKLNARLAGAMMSIQAIKGAQIGLGFEAARQPGSRVHDEIFYENGKYCRKTNRAGGIEGGMSNGEDVVIRAAMKPIPTLYKPLRSVDIDTKEPYEASIERSDVCAVPAAAVIGEAVAAIEIANAFIEKFGGDSIEEMRNNYESYAEYARDF